MYIAGVGVVVVPGTPENHALGERMAPLLAAITGTAVVVRGLVPAVAPEVGKLAVPVTSAVSNPTPVKVKPKVDEGGLAPLTTM